MHYICKEYLLQLVLVFYCPVNLRSKILENEPDDWSIAQWRNGHLTFFSTFTIEKIMDLLSPSLFSL